MLVCLWILPSKAPDGSASCSLGHHHLVMCHMFSFEERKSGLVNMIQNEYVLFTRYNLSQFTHISQNPLTLCFTRPWGVNKEKDSKHIVNDRRCNEEVSNYDIVPVKHPSGSRGEDVSMCLNKE